MWTEIPGGRLGKLQFCEVGAMALVELFSLLTFFDWLRVIPESLDNLSRSGPGKEVSWWEGTEETETAAGSWIDDIDNEPGLETEEVTQDSLDSPLS